MTNQIIISDEMVQAFAIAAEMGDGKFVSNNPHLQRALDSSKARIAAGLRAAFELRDQASPGLAVIAAERRRQVDEEGWTAEHDDRHDAGELAGAGAAYALNAACLLHPLNGTPIEDPPAGWLWEHSWWKPNGGDNPVRDLARSGALLAAEIDRHLRAEARRNGEGA